ncbi:MAG TPA: hypothetical protein VG457_02260, partial [Planctomycetota bacterium]|nr:hypothetical protein [Planctomycetota bacterium]
MSRDLLAGSVLNAIAGSTERWPGWQVLVWNPNQVLMSQVATGTSPVPAVDISPYIESIHYEENIGFENKNNPTVTKAQFKLRRNPITGKNIRRGLLEDGVMVQILQGDERVSREDWIPVFTGTFRGRPGDDPGTPSQLTEGFDATAFGREESFLNFNITTQVFTGPIDVGVIALAIAAGTTGVEGLQSGTSFPLSFPVNAVFFRTDLQIAYQNTGTIVTPVWVAVSTPGDTPGMGLSQDEILFGAQGFQTLHVSNQIVDTNCLDALWQIFFLVGKKPKFDSRGRLTAVDVDLDKPAVRIFSAGDITVEAIQSQPNDIEVNNQVVLHGLDHNLSQVVQAAQQLVSLDAVTGFFDDVYKKTLWFSNDRSQAALDTYLVTRKKIWFSDAAWSAIDQFHGQLKVDTHYLFDARATIFALYLATKLGVAAIDYVLQSDSASGLVGTVVTTFLSTEVEVLAAARLAMEITSQVALAGLLWSMNFIGRGTYEIWGNPFQY